MSRDGFIGRRYDRPVRSSVQGAVGTPGLGGRRVTPDGLLAREDLGEVALSPDGRWLAYVVKRPRSMATFHKYDFLDGGDRGDVWLVEISGGVAQNLTGGASDGCGYWAVLVAGQSAFGDAVDGGRQPSPVRLGDPIQQALQAV